MICVVLVLDSFKGMIIVVDVVVVLVEGWVFVELIVEFVYWLMVDGGEGMVDVF